MKYTGLLRGLSVVGAAALVILLSACPNPMSADLSLEEGDGELEVTRYGGRYTPVESEFFPASKYQSYVLRDYLGWEFTPIAKSEDGRLVVGNAVNADGYDWKNIHIEAGAKAAVYWVVGSSRRGRDPWISSPRVIGTVDYESLGTSWRARFMMNRRLGGRSGLLYLDRFSMYLETAESVVDLEKRYSYEVAGTIDSETPNYLALFEYLRVESIEPIVLSDEKEITSFFFAVEDNAAAGIDVDLYADIIDTAISVSVDPSVDIPALVPTIAVSSGAAVSPASGTTGLFSGPDIGVDFTVTAENGSTQVYTATIEQEGRNNPPEVSFPDGDYLIAGAPETGVNGSYWYVAFRKYTNGTYYLIYPDASTWAISTTDTLSDFSEALYIAPSLRNAFNAPIDGWTTPGGESVPDLNVYEVPVASDTQYYSSPPNGATLYGVYDYYDVDGHADASTFQWYRVDTSAPGNFAPILGATERSYFIDGTEGGQVKFEVTPRDAAGASAASIMTEAITVGGG